MSTYSQNRHGELRPSGGFADLFEDQIPNGTDVMWRGKDKMTVISSYETDTVGRYAYRLRDRRGRPVYADGWELVAH